MDLTKIDFVYTYWIRTLDLQVRELTQTSVPRRSHRYDGYDVNDHSSKDHIT